MKLKYEGKRLAAYMKQNRVVDAKNKISISLGDAAKQTGLSKATLSRLEKGSLPDVRTYAIVCQWLGMPMESFFSKSKHSSKTIK